MLKPLFTCVDLKTVQKPLPFDGGLQQHAHTGVCWFSNVQSHHPKASTVRVLFKALRNRALLSQAHSA